MNFITTQEGMQFKNRKLNRWSQWDYSDFGFYFITICTKGRVCYLGDVKAGEMELNKWGRITEDFLEEIPNHFNGVFLDEHVVMPNHVHAIILITEEIEDKQASFKADRTKMLLPKIVQNYKAAVTRTINEQQMESSFGWQKSYHDHIIRTPGELKRVRRYIRENPRNWLSDPNNPVVFE